MISTAIPMITLANGALGRKLMYGRESSTIAARERMKRSGYQYTPGSANDFSIVITPTKIRNGAIYAAVARDWDFSCNMARPRGGVKFPIVTYWHGAMDRTLRGTAALCGGECTVVGYAHHLGGRRFHGEQSESPWLGRSLRRLLRRRQGEGGESCACRAQQSHLHHRRTVGEGSRRDQA